MADKNTGAEYVSIRKFLEDKDKCREDVRTWIREILDEVGKRYVSDKQCLLNQAAVKEFMSNLFTAFKEKQAEEEKEKLEKDRQEHNRRERNLYIKLSIAIPSLITIVQILVNIYIP